MAVDMHVAEHGPADRIADMIRSRCMSGSAHLVGLSTRGWLVQEFAYRYPDRTGALVLAGTMCWTRPPLELHVMMAVPFWSPFLLLVPWQRFLQSLITHGVAHSKPHTLAYLGEVFGQWLKAEFIRGSPDVCASQGPSTRGGASANTREKGVIALFSETKKA